MAPNTQPESTDERLTVPMLPALRYLLTGWMLVGAVLAGALSVSSAGDPQNVDGVIPLGAFCLFFVYLAWRSWTAGAVVAGDAVTFRGAWRSTVVSRAAILEVRVEPLVASMARRILGGQSLMTHEVVVQVETGPPMRLGPVGLAFVSGEGADQFVTRLGAALEARAPSHSSS